MVDYAGQMVQASQPQSRSAQDRLQVNSARVSALAFQVSSTETSTHSVHHIAAKLPDNSFNGQRGRIPSQLPPNSVLGDSLPLEVQRFGLAQPLLRYTVSTFVVLFYYTTFLQRIEDQPPTAIRNLGQQLLNEPSTAITTEHQSSEGVQGAFNYSV